MFTSLFISFIKALLKLICITASAMTACLPNPSRHSGIITSFFRLPLIWLTSCLITRWWQFYRTDEADQILAVYFWCYLMLLQKKNKKGWEEKKNESGLQRTYFMYLWKCTTWIIERHLCVSIHLKQKVAPTFQIYSDSLSSDTIPGPFNVNRYCITFENKW